MKRFFLLISIAAFVAIACSNNANDNRNRASAPANNSNQSISNANQTPAASQSAAPGRGADEIAIGGGKVSVEYGRPALQGRDLEAMMVPGQEWRMGANDATTLTTDVGLKFGDKTIAPGRYVLKAKQVEAQKWHLLIQQNDATVAEVPMTFQKVSDAAELMTIDLEERDNGGRLFLHWGTLTLASDFQKA